jgi:serine protease Do
MDRSRMKEESIVRVIEKVTKSVVKVNTLRVFHDVFYRVVRVKGTGSGFILDERGYILTNTHIIEKAERIVTTLTDERVFARAQYSPLSHCCSIEK